MLVWFLWNVRSEGGGLIKKIHFKYLKTWSTTRMTVENNRIRRMTRANVPFLDPFWIFTADKLQQCINAEQQSSDWPPQSCLRGVFSFENEEILQWHSFDRDRDCSPQHAEVTSVECRWNSEGACPTSVQISLEVSSRHIRRRCAAASLRGRRSVQTKRTASVQTPPSSAPPPSSAARLWGSAAPSESDAPAPAAHKRAPLHACLDSTQWKQELETRKVQAELKN